VWHDGNDEDHAGGAVRVPGTRRTFVLYSSLKQLLDPELGSRSGMSRWARDIPILGL
jgi:hypothetical protein